MLHPSGHVGKRGKGEGCPSGAADVSGWMIPRKTLRRKGLRNKGEIESLTLGPGWREQGSH